MAFEYIECTGNAETMALFCDTVEQGDVGRLQIGRIGRIW